MATPWRGVFPAVTTQFHDDQSLNLAGTATHVETLLKSGIHGVIMLGTVGENCSHDYLEKLDVLRATVKQVAGRVPVLSGVAECTTCFVLVVVRKPRVRVDDTVQRGRRAERRGGSTI